MTDPASPRQDLNAWLRPTALLALRSVAAKAIVLLAGLAAARLYSPSELGAAASFVAAAGLVGLLAACRYDLALTVVPSDAEAELLLVVAAVSVIVVALTAVAPAVAAGPWLVRRLHAPATVEPLRFAAPPAIAAIGFVTVALRWATRQRQYELIGRMRIRQALSQAGGQIGLGVLGWGIWGLALAGIAGSTVGGVRLSRDPIARLRSCRSRATLRAALAAARRHRRFAALSTVAIACQDLASGGIPILLAGLYGLRVAGLFVLANAVVTIPSKLVSDAVARTYLGDTALLMRTQPAALQRRMRQTVGVLALVGGPPLGVVLLAGPHLFSVVFGSAWQASGELARPLCVLAMAQLVFIPLSLSFAVLARVGVQSLVALARLVLTFAPIIIAHAAGTGAQVAVAAFSTGGCLACLLSLFVLDRLAAAAPTAKGWS